MGMVIKCLKVQEKDYKTLLIIKGYGKITEDNISDVVREIRLALLEADVNYKVVKEFVNNVKEKADYVTSHVDKDGIFNALNYFNLLS